MLAIPFELSLRLALRPFITPLCALLSANIADIRNIHASTLHDAPPTNIPMIMHFEKVIPMTLEMRSRLVSFNEDMQSSIDALANLLDFMHREEGRMCSDRSRSNANSYIVADAHFILEGEHSRNDLLNVR